MICVQNSLSEADRRSRLDRRASGSRSPDVPIEGPIASQRGGRARFDEWIGSSSRRASQTNGWTQMSERERTGDHGDDSICHHGES